MASKRKAESIASESEEDSLKSSGGDSTGAPALSPRMLSLEEGEESGFSWDEAEANGGEEEQEEEKEESKAQLHLSNFSSTAVSVEAEGVTLTLKADEVSEKGLVLIRLIRLRKECAY